MTSRDPILDAAHRFRVAVNEGSVHSALMRDRQKWGQLCASMDAIQDTQCAIQAWAGGPASDDLGERYLRLYGVLQALFLQQDAVKHAAEAVGEEWEPSADLSEIRTIRNKSIGHPTKQGSKDLAFGVVQHSLRGGYFELTSFNLRDDGGEGIRSIDLTKLLREQSAAISGEMNHLAAVLEARASNVAASSP